MIPYGRQYTASEELDAVTQVLNSDWLTQGEKVPEFERALAAYCNAQHAVAVSNGTAALHLACLALGLNDQHELWTSPNSFVASANCGRYCGAKVDFVDIDPTSRNLCPKALELKLKASAKKPKVVVVVHFAGYPVDMLAIAALAQQYQFKIIEDASHAIGSRYADSIVGDCRYSDVTTFSFHPVKTITTAEGGAITANDPELVKKLQQLRSHGIERSVEQCELQPWAYQQVALGFNYRMTDIQAALGLVQLQRLDDFIQRRRQLVAQYDAALNKAGITTVVEKEGVKSAWHLYAIDCGSEQKRLALYNALLSKKIKSQVHYQPIHLQPYYQQLGFKSGDFPNAETYYLSTLSLPLYPSLSDEQQQQIIAVVCDVLLGKCQSGGPL